MITIAVFIIIKYIFVIVKPSLNEGRFASIVCFIGPLTLGIYMLDPLLRILCYREFERLLMPGINAFFTSLIWIICSMTVGGLITLLFRKTPLLKKLF